MADKDPVLLTVLIETDQLRWFVAGIGMDSEPIPLMRSEVGNLDTYIGTPFDEQVSFLRHRLSGVLQRGCDRLWGRQKKPCQIIFVADNVFQQAEPELTDRVAEHFVQWMTSPPVVFFVSENGFPHDANLPLKQVAGDLEESHRTALDAGLPALVALVEKAEDWELSPPKKSS